MDRLDAIRLFLRVVDRGNFAQAAAEAGIQQPAVSKQVAALEQFFGAQLLRRTSRSMTLTAEGQALYESGTRLVGDFDALKTSIGSGKTAVAGLVRMTVAPMFGRLYIVPVLPAFFARYPGVEIDMTATARTVNLVEEGFDLVIRNGVPADSALVARRIAASPYVLVATPAYLAQHGVPSHPRDLAGHTGVLFAPSHVVRPWHFIVDGRPVVHMPQGPFRSSDADQIRTAVLAGMGLTQAPAWMFAAELAAGTVTAILPAFAPAPLDIHAIHAAGRRVPGKVRVLTDYLADALTATPLAAFVRPR